MEPEMYTLTAIGVTQTIKGTLNDAIRTARKIDREYQRAFGVTISDSTGEVVATVEDDQINRA